MLTCGNTRGLLRTTVGMGQSTTFRPLQWRSCEESMSSVVPDRVYIPLYDRMLVWQAHPPAAQVRFVPACAVTGAQHAEAPASAALAQGQTTDICRGLQVTSRAKGAVMWLRACNSVRR